MAWNDRCQYSKNMLVKKNPLLFSEMAVDQEGEEYVYEVEDEEPGKSARTCIHQRRNKRTGTVSVRWFV